MRAGPPPQRRPASRCRGRAGRRQSKPVPPPWKTALAEERSRSGLRPVARRVNDMDSRFQLRPRNPRSHGRLLVLSARASKVNVRSMCVRGITRKCHKTKEFRPPGLLIAEDAGPADPPRCRPTRGCGQPASTSASPGPAPADRRGVARTAARPPGRGFTVARWATRFARAGSPPSGGLRSLSPRGRTSPSVTRPGDDCLSHQVMRSITTSSRSDLFTAGRAGSRSLGIQRHAICRSRSGVIPMASRRAARRVPRRALDPPVTGGSKITSMMPPKGGKPVPMSVLVPIGDFSRMTHLSVKALRFYHDQGLLEPARIDPATGYRFYDPRPGSRGPGHPPVP